MHNAFVPLGRCASLFERGAGCLHRPGRPHGAAGCALLASVNSAWLAARQGTADHANVSTSALPLHCRRDLRLAATHAVHSAVAVVTKRYTLAGGSAVFADAPPQRCLRKVQVASQHRMGE